MTDNLKHWNAHADIDPAFTKAITGKSYKGTSPNPQYVVRCLTEMFGPVGQGFGWRVVAEDFRELGSEVLHWCRIEFWHTDRANTFEAYGQTKAAFPTSSGKYMVDEDAPKKSLTDAIVKAASHIGVAASIFLGRWDDQKYVAEVRAEYEAANAPPKQAKPKDSEPLTITRDPVKIADKMIDAIKSFTDAEALGQWPIEGTKPADAWEWIRANHPAQHERLQAAYSARITELTPKDADLGSDTIPYEGK